MRRPHRPRRASSRPAALKSMGELLLGALMLVFEGLLPFLSPAAWRAIFERATRLSDGQIRFVGLRG